MHSTVVCRDTETLTSVWNRCYRMWSKARRSAYTRIAMQSSCLAHRWTGSCHLQQLRNLIPNVACYPMNAGLPDIGQLACSVHACTGVKRSRIGSSLAQSVSCTRQTKCGSSSQWSAIVKDGHSSQKRSCALQQ